MGNWVKNFATGFYFYVTFSEVAENDLTNELQHFIARYIVSIEKLETLLLLSGSPEKLWTVDEVFQKIQSSHTSVGQRLKELASEGFLVSEGDRYRYKPKTEDLEKNTEELRGIYRTRRLKVIEAVFSKSTEQLRKFSDAFRLRKDE